MQLETTSNYISIPNNSYVGTNSKVINNTAYDPNQFKSTEVSTKSYTLEDGVLINIFNQEHYTHDLVTVNITYHPADTLTSYTAYIYGGIRLMTKESITYSNDVSIYTKYNDVVNIFTISAGKSSISSIIGNFCNFIMETYGLTNVTYSSGNYYRGWLNNIPSGFIIKDINSGFFFENAHLRSIMNLQTYVHTIADPINGCKLSMSGLLSNGFYAFGTVIYGNKVNADVTITKSFI